MDIVCTQDELNLFERIGKAAELMNVSAYVVGGFVRDKLLGRPTKDVDIVCTGDGILLAHEVANTFKNKPQVNYFKTFGTAQFRLQALDVEFVGARRESY